VATICLVLSTLNRFIIQRDSNIRLDSPDILMNPNFSLNAAEL
jgi:hypothetical protein